MVQFARLWEKMICVCTGHCGRYHPDRSGDGQTRLWWLRLQSEDAMCGPFERLGNATEKLKSVTDCLMVDTTALAWTT